MLINRRTMMVGIGSTALATAFVSKARAAEFNYKYANNLPLSHPMNVRAKEAADRILEETGGRVSIQIFPSNQLGADTDMLSQVRSGGVEFFTLSPLILSTLVHGAGLTEAVPPRWLISTGQLVIGIGLAMRFRGMSHALLAQGIGMATLSVAMMLTLAALLAWGLSLTGEHPFQVLLMCYAPGGVV